TGRRPDEPRRPCVRLAPIRRRRWRDGVRDLHPGPRPAGPPRGQRGRRARGDHERDRPRSRRRPPPLEVLLGRRAPLPHRVLAPPPTARPTSAPPPRPPTASTAGGGSST